MITKYIATMQLIITCWLVHGINATQDSTLLTNAQHTQSHPQLVLHRVMASHMRCHMVRNDSWPN